MTYLFSNDWEQAQERLRGLERIEDESTFRQLTALGVTRGWRCLEVGAGAGSVARWLCECVAPTGHVVATDIDPHLIESWQNSQLSVRRHNIVCDPIEPKAFDLVHVRHVLIHVPKERVPSCVEKLVGGLADGGVLLIEESDFATNSAEPECTAQQRTLYAEVMAHIHRFYEERGMDLRVGTRMRDLMEAAGVVTAGVEHRSRLVRGGSDEALFHRMTYTQLRESIIGRVSDAKYNEFLALHDDPDFSYRTRTTIATWGRKLTLIS